MNIDDKSALRPCTSCQMCGAVCPTSAISIQTNVDGFYRPVVDYSKCIDCGLCVKNCYKFDTSIRITQEFASKKLYAAWADNGEVTSATTSGGIADILARNLISKGYKCIGVGYDNNTDCAVGQVAITEDDTLSFRGSKYIQSCSVDAFKCLVKEYKTQKYAVFGLPCQVYAIDRFLRSKGMRDNHLLIDLYCHGCPSIHLWKKYIKETVTNVNGKGVVSVNFRSKIRGWGNFYVVVVVVVEGAVAPVRVVSPRINDPFYNLFFSDLLLNDSCYDCKLRSTLEYTDIRLGDFWGRSYVMNRKGVSGVTLCTPNAEAAFREIAPYIFCEVQDFKNFLPYQSYGKVYREPDKTRAVLLEQLNDGNIPLKTTLETYKSSLTLRKRLIFMCKNLAKLLPNSLISFTKSLIYRIK